MANKKISVIILMYQTVMFMFEKDCLIRLTREYIQRRAVIWNLNLWHR